MARGVDLQLIGLMRLRLDSIDLLRELLDKVTLIEDRHLMVQSR